MNHNRNLSVSLTKSEILWGFAYLIFDFMFLPVILSVVSIYLPRQLSLAELNFAYYLLNFLAVALIFHRFLWKNFSQLANHWLFCLRMVIWGLAAYFFLNGIMGSIVLYIDPDFSNLNDAAISAMTGSNFTLMAIGTVILVPPVEECLFRGVIFRGLYDKSRWAAYIVSIVAFSAVHIVNFVTMYTPTQLLLSFLLYLPAGLCLAVSYARSDTIFVPILIHTLVNAIGMHAMR